jgi:putative flippase GtrA
MLLYITGGSTVSLGPVACKARTTVFDKSTFPEGGSALLRQLDKLWSFLHRHILRHFEARRVVKNILLALPLIALGTWLLRYEVSHLQMNPDWAYKLNWPLITLLSFAINRVVTWRDRSIGWRQGAGRWLAVSLAHSSVSQTIYPHLTAAGMNYLVASSLLIVTLCPVSYVLNNVWVFASEKLSITQAARNLWLIAARIVFLKT